MSTSTGYVIPAPELAPGFEWVQAYDELLEQIAESNVVDADWPILKDMIKYKTSENIKSYLALGPPWPLSPQDALDARGDAYDALDSFTGPPFTIQRLCELSLAPRANYTSLPKWLRALSRTLSVSSTRDAFTETDPNDPLPRNNYVPTSPTSSSTEAEGMGANGATMRPGASREGTPVNAPLLSPIPWLDWVKSIDEPLSDPEPDHLMESTDSPTTQRVKQAFNTSPSTTSHEPLSASATSQDSPSKANGTATPTGGLVDEVDPGSGGSETADPVSLTHAGSAGALDAIRDSLESRFERASSPRVEKGSPNKGEGGSP